MINPQRNIEQSLHLYSGAMPTIKYSVRPRFVTLHRRQDLSFTISIGDFDDSSIFTAQSTASPTSSAATTSSLLCSHKLGETPCGSICCASGQYCAFAGQCATSSLRACDSELGLKSCGSICCASWQYCASDEDWYDVASTRTKETSSFETVFATPNSSVDYYSTKSHSDNSYSMESSIMNSHPTAIFDFGKLISQNGAV